MIASTLTPESLVILIHPGHTSTGAVVDPDGPGPEPPLVEHEEAVLMVAAICEALQEHGVPHACPQGSTSGQRRKNCIGHGGISVEIHFNTGGGDRTLVFYREGSERGLDLAHYIGRKLSLVLPWIPQVLRDTTPGYPNVIAALAWTKPDEAPPGILIECAFLDRKDQMAWIAENRALFADAVARGCAAMETR